jgi:hypothetical protein
MLEGNLGGAAKSMALGELTKAVSKSSGLPAALTATIGKESGATDAVGNAISSAVNNTAGNTSTGFSVKSLASAIDGSLGNFGFNKATTSSGPLSGQAWGEGATTPTNTNQFDQVDRILNSGSDNTGEATPLSLLSTPKTAPVSSVATPSSSSSALPINTAETKPYNGAEINYLYDIGGSDIFAPRKASTPKPDVLKYLQNNVATAAQGGSTEDLLNYVRK